VLTPKPYRVPAFGQLNCLIISASGMAEGGRILQHTKIVILFVGDAAETTDHGWVPEVKIFGSPFQVRSQVLMSGFQARGCR
jgi:hypothetical protein